MIRRILRLFCWLASASALQLWFETLHYPTVRDTNVGTPASPVNAHWCTVVNESVLVYGVLCLAVRPCPLPTYYNLTLTSFMCDAPNATALLANASSINVNTAASDATEFAWFQYSSTVVPAEFVLGQGSVGVLARTQCVVSQGLPLTLPDYQSSTNVNADNSYYCCETQTRLLNSTVLSGTYMQYDMTCLFLPSVSPSATWDAFTDCLTEDVVRSSCTDSQLWVSSSMAPSTAGMYDTYKCDFNCRSPCTTFRDRYVGLSTACTHPETFSGCLPTTHSLQCGINILRYSAFLCADAQENIQMYTDSALTQRCSATAGEFGCYYFRCLCDQGCARHATCNGAGWLFQTTYLADSCVCEPGYTGVLCEKYMPPISCKRGQDVYN